MASKTFKVTKYKTNVGYKSPLSWKGVNLLIQGRIYCFGPDDLFVLFFLHEDSPVAAPYYNPGAGQAGIFLSFRDMPVYIDLIRNEKPIYAYLNSDFPIYNRLSTSDEPVGEEES